MFCQLTGKIYRQEDKDVSIITIIAVGQFTPVSICYITLEDVQLLRLLENCKYYCLITVDVKTVLCKGALLCLIPVSSLCKDYFV